jgi:hypothetical protein
MYLIEGEHSFTLINGASLLVDNRELAWAERAVKHNPAFKWILGRYVEADSENSNKQFWSLPDLEKARESINNSPLNLLHRQHNIVGHYVDNELLYLKNDESAEGQNPFIEALAVFYHYYYPNEYKLIEAAHASGGLFFSMECVAKTISCSGDGGCGLEYDYAGPRSTTYCAHLNNGESRKQLNQPHFLGGALIFPPEKPGWSGAEVRDLSEFIRSCEREAAATYEAFEEAAPHLDPREWESMMALVMAAERARRRKRKTTYKGFKSTRMPGMKAEEEDEEQAREFDSEQRKKMAKKGAAMSDGSFPIANAEDLRNAIRLVGRAKNPAAAKAHIKRRAAALGLTSMLPDDWK